MNVWSRVYEMLDRTNSGIACSNTAQGMDEDISE
jgi:hypothetical protein